MTTDEIRETVSMFDVAADYGIKISRHGMCSCPFHGKDKHPSMKIYKDGYKCFACGEAGDVFDFVQKADNCSFKAAFLKLGGTYRRGQTEGAEALRRAAMTARKAEAARAREADREFKQTLGRAITMCDCIKRAYEPFSDEWCIAANAVDYLEYGWCQLIDGKEVNKVDVYRECQRLERDYLASARVIPGTSGN